MGGEKLCTDMCAWKREWQEHVGVLRHMLIAAAGVVVLQCEICGIGGVGGGVTDLDWH